MKKKNCQSDRIWNINVKKNIWNPKGSVEKMQLAFLYKVNRIYPPARGKSTPNLKEITRSCLRLKTQCMEELIRLGMKRRLDWTTFSHFRVAVFDWKTWIIVIVYDFRLKRNPYHGFASSRSNRYFWLALKLIGFLICGKNEFGYGKERRNAWIELLYNQVTSYTTVMNWPFLFSFSCVVCGTIVSLGLLELHHGAYTCVGRSKWEKEMSSVRDKFENEAQYFEGQYHISSGYTIRKLYLDV